MGFEWRENTLFDLTLFLSTELSYGHYWVAADQ